MAPKTKKKLCWNCEGNVSLQDETCPYCGVSLDISPIPGTNNVEEPPTPPYKLSSVSLDTIIPLAPYSTQASEEEAVKEDAVVEEQTSPKDLTFQKMAAAISSLVLGLVFVLFGIILVLFSNSQGIFTLSWHGSYWFLYILLGLPLLYIGWRITEGLNHSED